MKAIYELDGYMDFERYGQDCMGNDCVTKTEFGLLRVKVKSFAPRQIQRRSFAALAIALSRKIF